MQAGWNEAGIKQLAFSPASLYNINIAASVERREGRLFRRKIYGSVI
jgi:hypothetical protein